MVMNGTIIKSLIVISGPVVVVVMFGSMIIMNHDSRAHGDGGDDWDHNQIMNHDFRVRGGGGDDWDHDNHES